MPYLPQNPLLGVKKIAKFFELPLNEEELKEVAERSSFQAMKNNSKETHGVFGNVLFRKGKYLKRCTLSFPSK